MLDVLKVKWRANPCVDRSSCEAKKAVKRADVRPVSETWRAPDQYESSARAEMDLGDRRYVLGLNAVSPSPAVSVVRRFEGPPTSFELIRLELLNRDAGLDLRDRINALLGRVLINPGLVECPLLGQIGYAEMTAVT
jgi:hypothetical protein